MTTTIAVGSDYDVLVGHDILDAAADLVPTSAARVLVVCSPAVQHISDQLSDALAARDGLEVHRATVPDAESAKSVEVLADLWGQLGRAAFTRTDAIVCVGGGTVTDLGGFAAATWLRGVPVVQVPTTLLAMVDAAVGGKTGINTAEGKNLVGAFYPPVGVVCDLATLRTLPEADLRAGMAEVVKGGFIADPRILELVETDPAAALDVDGPVLRELVERKIAVKARVVAADLLESSLREILNYGHTFAHAIEQVEHYTWRHGDAVAVGLVFAAELSHAAGRLSASDVQRHRDVLEALRLPTRYPGGSWPALRTAMSRDKKSRGSSLRFVVLDAVGEPGRLEAPDEELLAQAFAAVS
ncbi:3-dehydroquinate synthase [Arsenicicoccus piscis]|uniref:3-dehydroquinate synthase n=1 Tax=Arsenicicoccus piscis TaxID=673954 RepID=A0ABQ6HL37_9MICO|nr:3-dehydroquinate synthase [Arsenicicoccus piscis]MCH8627009.1 3-dehydroquinate synthase [Arsenicicoccus piscis]GMA19066.1 3-dehydroquinate synthase [Arsenicicoccus piscis]